MATRRVTGEGSIYQRKSDGRWVGVVDLGWVGGKRVRKTVTAPTLRELKPKFNKLKVQVDAGVIDDDSTVEKWMNHWLDNIAAKKVRPSTLRTYRGYTDSWIVPELGRFKLTRLTVEHVEALLASMELDGKADATRRQVWAILRRALEVARKRGKVPVNVAALLEEPPSVGQGSHGHLTVDEARKVLKLLGDPKYDAARWAVALLAGLRQGEALGLRWENVDLDERLIKVRVAAQRVAGQGIILVEPKSKASVRDVPMVEPVWAALNALPGREGYVFGGDKPRDARRDWQAWKDLLAAAGVDSRPLHAARATCASLLEAAGVSPTLIKEILGHSQVQVTQRHYLHGDVSRHRGAMGQMTDYLALGAA